MRKSLKFVFFLLLLLVVCGMVFDLHSISLPSVTLCPHSSHPPTTPPPAYPPTSPPPKTGPPIANEINLTTPNGESIFVAWWVPSGDGPFPAVIVVPNMHRGSAGAFYQAPYRELVKDGFVLVGFEPEGVGRSTGVGTCLGPNHQADLKAVIEFVASLPYVDRSNIGLVSFSGAALLAGTTLGRYPDLPVAYWVYGEGPCDGSMVHAKTPDCSDLCNHCNTKMDPSPENKAWWDERSPVNFISNYRGHYLRVQAEVDHEQGRFVEHALRMNNAAVRGGVPWVRINGVDIGNSINTLYLLDDPSRWPKFYNGRLRHHPQGETGILAEFVREMAALVASERDTSKMFPQEETNKSLGFSIILGSPNRSWAARYGQFPFKYTLPSFLQEARLGGPKSQDSSFYITFS